MLLLGLVHVHGASPQPPLAAGRRAKTQPVAENARRGRQRRDDAARKARAQQTPPPSRAAAPRCGAALALARRAGLQPPERGAAAASASFPRRGTLSSGRTARAGAPPRRGGNRSSRGGGAGRWRPCGGRTAPAPTGAGPEAWASVRAPGSSLLLLASRLRLPRDGGPPCQQGRGWCRAGRWPRVRWPRARWQWPRPGWRRSEGETGCSALRGLLRQSRLVAGAAPSLSQSGEGVSATGGLPRGGGARRGPRWGAASETRSPPRPRRAAVPRGAWERAARREAAV